MIMNNFALSRRLLLCLSTLSLGLLLAIPAWAEVKVGIVDLQKILKTSVAGKAAQKKFETLRKEKEAQVVSRESDLAKREKSLLAAREEIEKAAQDSGGKPTEELKQKAMAFQEQVRKLEQDAKEFDKRKRKIVDELAAKEGELLKPIEDNIKAKIDAIAKERGLSLVLSRQVAVYVNDALDITAEVIKRCDGN